jgi:hypothetical protein
MTRPLVAETGSKAGGYDTNNDTNQEEFAEKLPQVIENMVSAAGFEPATHALKGLPRRKINNLHEVPSIVTECYRSHVQQGFALMS